MGVFSLIMPILGVNHFNNSMISGLYFLLSSALGCYLFLKQSFEKSLKDPYFQFVCIFSLIIIYLCTTTYFDYLRPEYQTNEEIFNTKLFFALFKPSSSFSKVTDIIFQQLMIFSILQYLNFRIKNKKEVQLIFTTVFFIIHIPLFALFGFAGIVFVLPSLFAGYCFVYLIQNFKYGFIYSFSLHLSFYLFMGIILRETNLINFLV